MCLKQNWLYFVCPLSTVRNEILRCIKETKYVSILFYRTSDISHREQECKIIRFVKVSPDGCTVEESLIDFKNKCERTG